MAEERDPLHLRNLTECGISAGLGAAMVEAAAVCFEDQGHPSGVSMTVQGSYDSALPVEWDGANDRMRRSWADEQVATEQGACGCAILLADRLAGLQVVQQARKGTGFDWWLGESAQGLFQDKARLEVSGIRSGKDKVRARVNRKKKQTKSSDSTRLEALVVVVEFGEPLSHVEKRS